MSKGQIVDAKGEGLYTVKLKYAVDQVKQEIEELGERLLEIASELPDKERELRDAESEAEAKAGEINALIPLYQEDPDAHRAKMTALQAELAKLGGEARKVRGDVERLKAERLSARKRKAHLERIPEEKEMDCWCADHTEDLFGEVGLIDVNDEGGRLTLVHPGHEGRGAYSKDRDGVLMPREAQSGAQAWFNAAILAGIQKFAARYRLGEITAIDGDTCTVKLDEAKSSAQDLNINQQEVLEGVPAEYMTCGMSVFEIADRVVVRIENGPAVVGFESNPRPCYTSGVLVMPYSASCPGGFGFPWEDENGQPINGGLGTCGGHSKNAIFAYREGSPEVQMHTSTQAGMHYWTGWDGVTVSTGSWSSGIDFGKVSHIYIRGKKYRSPDGSAVIGCCMYKGVPVIVCEGVNVFSWTGENWQLLASYGPEPESSTNGWFFNKSGTKARSVYKKEVSDTEESYTVCALSLSGESSTISASITSEITEHKGIYYNYEEVVTVESGVQKIGDEPIALKRRPFPEEEITGYFYNSFGFCAEVSPGYATSEENSWIVCGNDLEAELEKVKKEREEWVKARIDEAKAETTWTREEYESFIELSDPRPWNYRTFSQNAQEALGRSNEVVAWQYRAYAGGTLYDMDPEHGEYVAESEGTVGYVYQYLSPRYMVDGSSSVTVTTKRWTSDGGTSLVYVGFDEDEEVDLVIEAKEPLTLERERKETNGSVEGFVYKRVYLESCTPDDDDYYIPGRRRVSDLDHDNFASTGSVGEWGPLLGGYKVLVNGEENAQLSASVEGPEAMEPPLIMGYYPENKIEVVQVYNSDVLLLTESGRFISGDGDDSEMEAPQKLVAATEWEGLIDIRPGVRPEGSGVVVDSQGAAHFSFFDQFKSFDSSGEKFDIQELYPGGDPGSEYRVKLVGKI